MSQTSVWIDFIAIAVFAYIVFVFLSESFNPFSMKKGQGLRRRWRLARSIALIIYIVSTLALLVKPFLSMAGIPITLAVVMLCIIFFIYPIYRYRRLDIQPNNTQSSMPAQTPATTTQAPSALRTATSPKAALPEADLPDAALPPQQLTAVQSPNISLSSSQTVAIVAREVADQDISKSEEHELELELSSLSIEEELDDLDQTISEADFISSDLTISEIREIARPDLSGPSLESLIEDDHDIASDTGLDFSDEYINLSHSQQPYAPETIDPHEALLQLLGKQNEEIQDLANSNKSLKETRETLEGEMAELKHSLQKSNAMTRKSIAQRDHAVKIKNSALTLAAMELKKRKLIEIKARKALLKMQNSLRELTDERVD